MTVKFIPALHKKLPNKTGLVLFHQSNAPAHWALLTQQFHQNNNNFEVFSHYPCTPDLATSDFWLFPIMRDTLNLLSFPNLAAVASAIFQRAKHTPKEEFSEAMESWLRCCEKCFRLQGFHRKVTVMTTFWVMYFNRKNLDLNLEKLRT